MAQPLQQVSILSNQDTQKIIANFNGMRVRAMAGGGMIGPVLSAPASDSSGPVARIDISLGGGKPERFSSSPDDIQALVLGLQELQRAT